MDFRRITRSAVTVSLGARGQTDARRAEPGKDGEVRRGPVRAKQKPVFLVLLVLVFLTGTATALFAQGGMLERRRLEATQAGANVELDRQLRRVHELRRDVHQLRGDSLARERLAREELGYSREGEVIFLLAEPSGRP